MKVGNRSRLWCHGSTVKAILCLLAVGLATACSGLAEEMTGSSSGQLDVVMGVSGYDVTVRVDGEVIGRLHQNGQRISRSYAPGEHTLTLHDTSSSRESYPYDFSIVADAIRTITIGQGDTPITWR